MNAPGLDLSPRTQLHRPNRLWSLWDMLKAYAAGYYLIAECFLNGVADLEQWDRDHPNDAIGPGERPHKGAMTALSVAMRGCQSLPLGTISKQIVRTQKAHEGQSTVANILARDLMQLQLRFRDELTAHKFFYVGREEESLYGQEKLFGDKVWSKFKEAREDIRSAGDCLALGQSTACVFHLMRALEAAIRKLGKRIGVTNATSGKKTWRKITDEMDAKIKQLKEDTPARRGKKDAFEAARANMHHVGSVWRNGTMHPAKSYTPRQARDVLEATRVSMQSLAAL